MITVERRITLMTKDKHDHSQSFEHLLDRHIQLEKAFSKQNEEVCQTLGQALGYPWYMSDLTNFPDATEENGVCVGDHVVESIATEAAKHIEALETLLDKLIVERETNS